MSSTIQNVYYERKTATPRPCFICHRPTTTVLATIKMEDFMYTCEGHLTDPASLVVPAAAPTPGPSADDIKKVISDYHAREARKVAGAKGEDKKAKSEEDGKDKEKGKVEDPKKDTKDPAGGSSPASTNIPTSSPTSTHKKYTLHRHIFEMRKNELRKKEQGVKAKEVSRGMPQVPRTAF